MEKIRFLQEIQCLEVGFFACLIGAAILFLYFAMRVLLSEDEHDNNFRE